MRLIERGIPEPDCDCILASLSEVDRHCGPTVETQSFTNARSTAMIVLLRPVDLAALARSMVIQSPMPAPAVVIRERRSVHDDLALLTADDWLLADAWTIRRMGGWSSWGNFVSVTYTAVVDVALRDDVALGLAQLAMSASMHRSETLGDHRVDDTGDDIASRRRDLLAMLSEGRAVVELG